LLYPFGVQVVGGAGVDSVWEQEKPEARKMLACTVPQAQVKMRQNLHRPLHALLARF